MIARRLAAILCVGLFSLAACDSASTQTASEPSATSPQIVRHLATVYTSPTPGEEERRATQIAARPTVNLREPTQVPSPTIYIGVFLGAEQEEGVSIVDAARFQGTLAALSPTLSADATTTLTPCTIPTDPVFGTSWAANTAAVEALRCPVAQLRAEVGSSQLFERGVMYFVPSGDIWAIVASGSAGGPYWHVPQAPPEQTWEVAPPDGLRMPRLGFGAVWRAVDGVREALGFARTDETAASLSIQQFEGGSLLLDSSSGQVFVLVGTPDDGTAYGPY
ncbi:MAG: serine/threonine protein kinase [Chloroflexi bacterium OLB15]|nr:MAG: serine/threonine protein kinase [Chloroflexi bacterium OLB15]